MNLRRNVISKVIASADLDAELEPRLPIVELAGTDRVLIENHQSVIGYAPESISVKVRFGSICVSGCNLKIAKMSKDQLIICGDILYIQLNKEATGC